MINTWDQLANQQPRVSMMLKNSLMKNRVAHAYLFEGERGTGKKDTSILLAKSLFCHNREDGFLPCEECTNCKKIDHKNHADVHVIEPDGLSIKKEQIRLLHEEFQKKAVESSQKVYIITHAHKMTASAANSLLKFLEEPHAGTTIILLTDQIHRMLSTILSRCQTLSFMPLNPKELSKQLIQAGVPVTKAPLIASLTNSVDEGLSLNEDEWFAQAQKIVVKLFEAMKNPVDGIMVIQESWLSHFKEREQTEIGLMLLLNIYRDLLYIQLDKPEEIVYKDMEERLRQLAIQHSPKKLAYQMNQILESKRKISANINPQLLMEQLVLNLQEGFTLV
ncbi:DNA polymerase III subunit delta' [Pradoshia sp. D12]|uniref:DNA polymerase III subunit delta' n=1 Tax=Bacillaceae TaxID=186817 RepID=UPI00080AF218|nr:MULTISPECIES: DNA polymerase III subunit delta' [Bacillaceae]OCA88481.1 DNA polymerase III subunit delta' [Bacillus sp. FJAT-27986]QFK69821.1 DNA polymerase III subunit delta' [Pradoshia sp. D12]